MQYERKETCRVCGKEFTTRRELYAHAKSEHPEFYRESHKLLIALIPFIPLVAALGIMSSYFQDINPNFSWTLYGLLLVVGVGGAYIGYRIYRLPEKYKPRPILV